jgi:hypothetical protein
MWAEEVLYIYQTSIVKDKIQLSLRTVTKRPPLALVGLPLGTQGVRVKKIERGPDMSATVPSFSTRKEERKRDAPCNDFSPG